MKPAAMPPLPSHLLILALLMPLTQLTDAEPSPSWDASFDDAPATFPAEGFTSPHPEIRALFFAGPPYQGKPTRVSAYLGLPPIPATLVGDTATATLPPDARLYYVNLTDVRGLVVSTEYYATP